jgi:hypothetical protein
MFFKTEKGRSRRKMSEKKESTDEDSTSRYLVVLFVLIIILIVLSGLLWGLDMIVPDISKAKSLDGGKNTACLYVQDNLVLKLFDGQKVTRKAGFMAKAAAVNVPEGDHSLVFDFNDGDSKAENFEFKAIFESGGYYYVNYKKYKEDKKNKVSIYLRSTEKGVYRDPEIIQHWYSAFFYYVIKILKFVF